MNKMRAQSPRFSHGVKRALFAPCKRCKECERRKLEESELDAMLEYGERIKQFCERETDRAKRLIASGFSREEISDMTKLSEKYIDELFGTNTATEDAREKEGQ
jgi:hypothetical protein